MEVVSQEIGARIPTVSIENAKEGTFWPIITFFTGRLHNVKNDGYSVFIVVSDNSLVSIGSIT